MLSLAIWYIFISFGHFAMFRKNWNDKKYTINQALEKFSNPSVLSLRKATVSQIDGSVTQKEEESPQALKKRGLPVN